MTCMTLSTTQACVRRLPFCEAIEQEVARRDAVGDLVRDVEAQVPLEVLDRLGAQLLQPAHVVLVARVELVDPQEAVDLLAVGEVQAVPVDDRPPPQEVPDGGQVA